MSLPPQAKAYAVPAGRLHTALLRSALCSSQACSGREGLDLKEIFARFDENGDGDVTRQEFIEALQDLGVDLHRWELHACYKHLDPSGDGKVDYEEFCRYY